ncbi:MAG: hypothetical protein D6679_13360 [Candidatus Hydrogenedentota bacterium]|nr:MAG: hypothetical protein D6679_13360 [Candidatus Hydrogenedentota bacterium]
MSVEVTPILAATKKASGPEKALLSYFDSLKNGRFDRALNLLEDHDGSEFFTNSLRLIRNSKNLKDAKAWSEAIAARPKLHSRLPFYRQKDFPITVTNQLIVGRHARVWFTYGSGSDRSKAYQDFVRIDGRWLLTS